MGIIGGIALIIFGVLIILFGNRRAPDIGRPGVISRLLSTYGREREDDMLSGLDIRKWGIGVLCIYFGIRLMVTHGHL